MKKFTLLTLLIAAVTITGCKKDEKESSKNIVGKWLVKQTVEKKIVDGVIMDEETEIQTDFGVNDFIEFKSDGKTISSIKGDQNNGTYQVKNNRLLVTEADGSDLEDYEIRKFTSNELVIYIEDEDGPNSKETFEMTLRK